MLSNLIDRMKLPFRKDKELYLSLRQIIGFYPHDIGYYKLALMHKSMFKRNAKGKPVNNERLEFLGDAILDATVGDIVYRHFPGKRAIRWLAFTRGLPHQYPLQTRAARNPQPTGAGNGHQPAHTV